MNFLPRDDSSIWALGTDFSVFGAHHSGENLMTPPSSLYRPLLLVMSGPSRYDGQLGALAFA